MDYLLGIDLGTSGAKAAIIDTSGALISIGRSEYAIETPQPGWAEQSPAAWIDAVQETVKTALGQAGIRPSALAAIGLSGQMHTTVCLGSAGEVLRPAILWADQRSRAEVDEVYLRLGKEKLAEWAQNPLATGFTLATLLWLQEYEADLYGRIRHVLLPKDYLRYYLTGEIATDASDASATLLMNVGAGAWNADLLDTCNVNPAVLPAIHASTEVAGRLQAGTAAALGLPSGIPVAYGSGDQAAQAVGNGIVKGGLVSCTIGTGGQILAPSLRPAYDPELRLHTFCHALPGQWFVMAATLSAGLSLNWLRHQVLGGTGYGVLADAAADIPAGAEGLYFLPYLAGERTPHMDASARAAFVGLTLRHGRDHMTRAVMEGVIFSLRQGLELIDGIGVPIERIVASGGATRHPLWLQLQADILQHEIYQTQTEEAAASGAALIAGVAIGVYPDIPTACLQAVRWSEVVVRPDADRAAAYDGAFRHYSDLYPALRQHFHSVAGSEDDL